MYTQSTNKRGLRWAKLSLIIAVALCAVLYMLVAPVSAAEDPATPMNVNTNVSANFVTVAWTSTVDTNYTLYRSNTNKWEDATDTKAALLSSVNVDSPEISYSFEDSVSSSSTAYTYWIVNKDPSRGEVAYGPYQVQLGNKIFLPGLFN